MAILNIGQCTQGCWDDYLVSLPATANDTWTANLQENSPAFHRVIPLPRLQQTLVKPGRPSPMQAGAITTLRSGSPRSAQSGNTTGNYVTYFEVDNVSFY